MENVVKYIKKFLETKSVLWQDEELFDKQLKNYRPAKDEDFDGRTIKVVRLRRNERSQAVKSLLVNEKLFLVISGNGTRLELDISDDWKAFLSTIKELQKKNKTSAKKNAGKNAAKEIRNEDLSPEAIERVKKYRLSHERDDLDK